MYNVYKVDLDKSEFKLTVYAKNLDDAFDIIHNVEDNSADMARRLMFKSTITKQYKTMGGYVLDYDVRYGSRFDRSTAESYLEDLSYDDEPIFSREDTDEVITKVPDYSSKIKIKFRPNRYDKDAREAIFELAKPRIGFSCSGEDDELGRNIFEAEFNGIEQFCKMVNYLVNAPEVISVHYE